MILKTLSHRADGRPGGGALLLVIRNSTHDTFSDLPVLFATRFSWLLSRVRPLRCCCVSAAVVRSHFPRQKQLRFLSRF